MTNNFVGEVMMVQKIVADALQGYPNREILRLHTSPKFQRKQSQNYITCIKLIRAGFHYKYIHRPYINRNKLA